MKCKIVKQRRESTLYLFYGLLFVCSYATAQLQLKMSKEIPESIKQFTSQW